MVTAVVTVSFLERPGPRTTGGWLLAPAIAAVCWIFPSPRAAGADGPVDFRRDILPILSENCFLCHGPDAKTRKADLRLDVKEGALRNERPGDRAGQERRERADSPRSPARDPDEVMPPPQIGQDADAASDRAAEEVDRPGCALEQALGVRAAAAADAAAGQGARLGRGTRSIAFVLARLEVGEARATRRRPSDGHVDPPRLPRPDGPAAVAGGGRRVPGRSARPTPTSSSSIACWPRPHYGERMAMDWLDGARYADTNGYQNDFARTMWPWRDWVIAAFNANQPFDRFTDRADRRRPAAGRDPGAEDRHRLQPQQPDGHRGRLDRRGMARRERGRPGRDDVDGLPRA